jgi:hypothetical protein
MLIGNSYGASGDLVTAFGKKIFFFSEEHSVYVKHRAVESISLREAALSAGVAVRKNLSVQMFRPRTGQLSLRRTTKLLHRLISIQRRA